MHRGNQSTIYHLALIRWIASFLNDRTAAIRLNGRMGDQQPVEDRCTSRLSSCPI